MKEIVIVSGKGGTGKTTLTAALAALEPRAVLADCDVDAADLHLVTEPRIIRREEFRSGHEAWVNQGTCIRCGDCEVLCRFDAIRVEHPFGRRKEYGVDPVACEGCGVCEVFCPVKAVEMRPRVCGELYVSRTRFGVGTQPPGISDDTGSILVHARLDPGGENSGKLVTRVRSEAARLAEESGTPWLISDGPPGVGCPVIASVSGADAVLLVSEPSPSGDHDLTRVLKLIHHFSLPAFVVINRWDLHPELALAMEAKARETGATILERIPWDPLVTAAQVAGKSIVELEEGPAARAVKEIWRQLCKQMA